MSDWRTILAIDHDPKACEAYRANVPEVERVECAELADMLGTLPAADVVLGGPPCQPYSSAGKRGGDADERDCVPDFCAAVEEVRPRMFLMEEVAAFATDAKFQRVVHRTMKRFRDAGYDVQVRVLDAVNYGVPQFRNRAWFWGVRSDLADVIQRRNRGGWPVPTHAWPWPEPSMFGATLLPAVVVGEALEFDGWTDCYGRLRNCSRAGVGEAAERLYGVYDAQNDRVIPASRPCSTIQGEAQAKGGGAGHYAIRRPRAASVERRDHPVSEPCPTLTDGSGGSGGILRVVGQQSHADPERPINEPASTLRSGGGGHDGCCVRVHEYRWSDAMLTKHPPASPASTVQAKWSKGGADGLVEAMANPSPTISGGGTATGGAEPVRHGPLRVRRLTPEECARLQSMPDGFIWPESVKKTHRYRVIGNGWASLMAKRLSEAFRRADPESRTVIDLFCGGGCGAVGWHGRAWEYQAAEVVEVVS